MTSQSHLKFGFSDIFENLYWKNDSNIVEIHWGYVWESKKFT